MSDQLHHEALATLDGWDPPDEEQAALRDRFLRHLRDRPDGCRRGCYPTHLTAGTLVVSRDGAYALLNLHRKARRWFAFGGHAEEGDRSLADLALREAREESGIDDLVPLAGPLQLDAHRVGFCDPRGTVTHLDVRFGALGDPGTSPSTSSESLTVRWWPVDALPAGLEQDVRALVSTAAARATSPPGTPAPSPPAGSAPPTPRTSRRDGAR